jgi:hypothetical protein
VVWKASVLVVANVTADSDELLQALCDRAERGATTFTLLVPATGGGPEARAAAVARLEAALARAREADLEIEGALGDAEPVTAVHEAWSPAVFDEVIVSTLSTGASKWLQIDLPHRIERLTGAPVTHVTSSPRPDPPPASPARVRDRERHGVLSPLTVMGWGRGKDPQAGSPTERGGGSPAA